LVARITKEAIKNLGIPYLSSDDEEQFTNPRWNIFYQEVGKDILLSIQLTPCMTRGMVHTSLSRVVWSLLNEIEILLSNPRAMTLLKVEESEREAVIYDKTLKLTQDYIHYLPIVVYHSFHQTLNEVVISYIKKIVDFDLREYWDKIGKPQKNFTLLPNNELKDIERSFPETNFWLLNGLQTIDEECSIYRKGALSGRKVWLNNPEALAKLPSAYKQFKFQYKEAKREHKLEYEAFKRINPRASNAKWEKHWEKVYDEKFPNIYQTELTSYSASELAYRQLAETYDFSPEYMMKLVRIEKAKANREAQKRDEKPDN